jgi:predicted nucleotidyltransferase
MKDLAEVLRDFAALFERMGTQYAVMGGMAVRVYGIPRPTQDIDFTLAIKRTSLPAFFQAVQDLGYTVAEEYARGWVDSVAGMPLVKVRLYLEGRGIDIDIFLAESRFQEQLLARRRREQMDGLGVWLVTPEDLILLKLLAGRPRDLADIADILFMQGKLDETHMRDWAQQLGIRAELERVLAEPPPV